MASGDPFNFEVHTIKPKTPKWNVLQTDYEGWNRKTRLKSTDSVRGWEIGVRGRTNTEKDIILAHFNDHKGPLTFFTWNVLPTIWNAGYGTSYIVTYASMEYVNPGNVANIWDFVINFEEWL